MIGIVVFGVIVAAFVVCVVGAAALFVAKRGKV